MSGPVGDAVPYAYVSGIDGSYNDAKNSTNFRLCLESHRAGRPHWPENATLLYTATQPPATQVGVDRIAQLRTAIADVPETLVSQCAGRAYSVRYNLNCVADYIAADAQQPVENADFDKEMELWVNAGPRHPVVDEALRKSIESAIDCLRSSHIQNNKFRLGAIGSGEIDLAIDILRHALHPTASQQGDSA